MDSMSTPRAEGPPTETEKPVGCCHYKRKSKLLAPCCNKVYTCRFCHDESENHQINRKEITELVCALCNTRQNVQSNCINCGVLFGKYACLECNLFDDDEKRQFHCKGCGFCRIGGADRFFHCNKCNMCLPIKLKQGHKCVENVSRSNCPICFEDIHTSRIACHIPPCGHLLHGPCYEELLGNGLYACPICQTSLMDMQRLWKHYDMEIANTPMPPEYRNYYVEILCKDCHKESIVKFHVVGFKCAHCCSYNTCRNKGPVILRGCFRTGIRYFALFCNLLISMTRKIFTAIPYLFLIYDTEQAAPIGNSNEEIRESDVENLVENPE
ncbi:RING finger and CHY zinc finger domain-containing protein 1-like isoform X1 [Diorhabda carinulata]|uniref:RING finger and CHY zinc finger domain-containing protein 1-like isoform X1 n=1 Tax=Diorhabda carinulata TaxID=1163345 RepID=UPI0025A0338C|nr:RING finger and CHY zinc finger domain-containing protein 1-like isoform X1 [Diorhabda carinulata]